MHKYLLFLAVLLSVLSLPERTLGQSRTEQTRSAEAPFAPGSNASPGANTNKEISAQSRALAKQSYQMGVKYARTGLFKQAAASFQKAVQFDPTNADAYYGLGIAFLDLKQWREAVKAFEQAVRFNGRNELAHTKLAEARLKLHIASKPPPTETITTGVKVSLSETNTSRGETSTSVRDASSPVSDGKSSVSDAKNSLSDANVSVSDAGALAATSVSPNSADELTRVYRVGVGDVLDVRLGDAAPLQASLFTVTATGFLEHPNLPEPMAVSGFTTEEIEARLKDDLKRRAISENPNVVVAVREYVSHAILVSGLVKEPGTKLLRREAIPLYVVTADAQPLPEAGRLTLVQHESGEVLNINLADVAQKKLLVRSGDVITVHPTPQQFFYVGGEVKSPGEKSFRAGLTLMQAILVAEGLTSKAKEIQLARENGNGFLQLKRYKLKDINSGKLADPAIQPGDRITVVD